MKKWMLCCFAGLAAVLSVDARVRVAGKWGQSAPHQAELSIALAGGIEAKAGDVFVLTYAANKKGLYSFNITSSDGTLSEECRYEQKNGPTAGVIYYRVESDGIFDLSAYQSVAAFTTYGAYHLSSGSSAIQELANYGAVAGMQGVEPIISVYSWDNVYRSGVLIEGVSSYCPLSLPDGVELLVLEREGQRVSSYKIFSGQQHLNLKWGVVPDGGKNNLALSGIVFTAAEAPQDSLDFILH